MKDSQIREAVAWNRDRYSVEQTQAIQRALGVTADGLWGPQTVTAVLEFQRARGLKEDGKVGRMTLGLLEREASAESQPAGIATEPIKPQAAHINALIEGTVKHETNGSANVYAALNLDAEYEGWFDRPRKHPDTGAYLKPAERAALQKTHPGVWRGHWASKYQPDGGSHVGLSWGMIQFTQDGGALGEVLEIAHTIDADAFVKIMGGGSANEAKALLAVTTDKASGRKLRAGLEGKRSNRVLPVSGHDLWRPYWTARFNEAARHPAFQAAQRIIAATNYLAPALGILRKYGHSNPSEEDMAIAFDMAVQYGPGSSQIDAAGKVKGKGAERLWARAYVRNGRKPVTASQVVNWTLTGEERNRRLSIMRTMSENKRFIIDDLTASVLKAMLLNGMKRQ
jgi:hypothetical protein